MNGGSRKKNFSLCKPIRCLVHLKINLDVHGILDFSA